MRFTFVTHGDIETLATVKRATGLSGPLCDLGHEVSIIIQNTLSNRERLLLECPQATPLFFNDGSIYSQVRQKRILLRESKPDVVWVCGIGMRNWVCSLFRPQRPIMLVEHAEFPSKHNNLPFLRRFHENLMEWSTLFWFDGMACASRYLDSTYRRRLKMFGKQMRTLYSPYAYNNNVLSLPPNKLPELKRRHTGKKVIFYIGTLMSCYGIFEIIKAIAELKMARKDFILLIAGGGPEMADVAQAIRQQGLSDVIEMLGYVPEEELPSYFHLADAFLCPMRNTIQDWARCPSKLFMYLPFKRPIVTCRIGEALELLADDGFYFEPENVASLTSSLERAISVGESWRPTISDADHSWQTRANQLVAWINGNWSQ